MDDPTAARLRERLTCSQKVEGTAAARLARVGHAVTLVEGASAAPRRVLGVSVGESRDDRAASVDARVDGHVATVEASVAVGWPASVRTVADRLRRQVRDDVERITGVRVAHVDIDVVSLSAPPTARRRVQ